MNSFCTYIHCTKYSFSEKIISQWNTTYEFKPYPFTREMLFNGVIKWSAVFCQCNICHTCQNLYCYLLTCSFLCKEGMVKAVCWLTCLGYILRGSKFRFSLKRSYVKKCWKYEKKRQLQRQSPNYYVRSRSHFLTPRCERWRIITSISSKTECKLALRSLEEKRKMNFPFKQVQNIWKKHQQRWQTPNYYGRSRSQFSTPRSENWRIRTAISPRIENTRWLSSYNKRRGKRIFHSNRSKFHLPPLLL